jgi:D-3-phosphoglycerate dehydrogenase
MVESVNMVSAPSLLRDHGISSSETRKADVSDYAFEIRVQVVTDVETVTVSGTLFGDDDPRICSIDDTRMDAVPEGWMVVCMNDDKPNVIGQLTTLIGKASVNIANMTLGRNQLGGQASTLINIDGPLESETLEEMVQVNHVNKVRQVNL